MAAEWKLSEHDRLLSKTFQAPSGCWEWLGYRNAENYGRCGFRGKTGVGAHRAIYLLLIGPIPEGLHLDHLCRNHGCVNPLHLQPVTCRTNTLRGMTEAARNLAKTRCANGHPYDELNTYWRPDGARGCRECRRAAGRRHDAKRRSA